MKLDNEEKLKKITLRRHCSDSPLPLWRIDLLMMKEERMMYGNDYLDDEKPQ